MLSDVVYEPLTNKNCSITAAIINLADNSNLAENLTITQEEGYAASSTTNLETALSETSKSLCNLLD